MAATTPAAPGLARVTVDAPGRRVDVALPDLAPLAELLPELLRRAGDGLADSGQAHGGWLLRRADGAALSTAEGLATQGVRDGDVLHLVPARENWPELEYDDVVDVIAAGARRYGRGWDASATRATGLALAGALLLLGLVALLRTGTGGPALGLGALLIAAGALASRTAGDALTGVTLAALGAPYASAGAVLAAFGRPYAGAAPARPGLGPSLLLGSAVLILACVLAALGVGHGVRVFTGGAVAGLAGVLGAALSWRLNAPGCAAVVVTALVTGVGAVPLLATRLGHLPVPVLAGGGEAHPRPERARVYAAVVRTDELLTGTLLGVAGAAAAGTLVLILFGGGSAWLLAGVAATGLALRARVFPALRQRLPLLLAGAVGYLTLLTGLVARVPPAGPLLPGLALIVVAAATRYRDRPPGPHLGRAADLLDALCVVAAVPAACAVLGLYGAVGGLVS